MVCTFRPPGVSSARANSRRANARRGPRHPARRSTDRRIERPSSSVVQCPSVSNTRLAMLAAAALVKVRQRIFSGATPASSRLITRCASTWVLPEPALAATQADTPGIGHLALHAQHVGRNDARRSRVDDFTGALPSRHSWRTRNIVFGAAGRRPLLHAREMIVVAIARLPHRMHQRTIRLVIVVEPPHQFGQLFQRAIGLACRACRP